MKNILNQNKAFTLLEILVVMGIISILLAVGFSAISQFGKRQNVVSQGYLVKNKLKSFQNSAINQRLEGEAERYTCGNSPIGTNLCDDNRWFYGVGVKIDYTNNKLIAQRIFKNASGPPDTAKLQWKEPAKFPTQAFTTAYLVGNNPSPTEFVIDIQSPISEAELLDEVKLYEGAGMGYIPGSGEVQIDEASRCDYIVFLAVTGKPIAFNGEDPNKNTSDVGGIDKCIVYMMHEDNPQMVRGLILRREQTTIEQCLSPLDCGNKLRVFGPS